MKKNLNKILNISLLAILIFNITCQKLDPVSVTKFSNESPVATPTSLTTTSVTGKFMAVSDDISSYGHCWAISPNATIDNFKTINSGKPTKHVEFISQLTELSPATIYYVRAYAIISEKIIYSDETSFNTSSALPNFTDMDDNLYHEVTIGTQVWMLENLKTSKYSDGTSITNVTDNTAWTIAGPAYCWYNNDAATYKAIYGALYNWKAVDPANNGNKNICPTGWHVPTDDEWTILITFLGGESVAGGKMKEAGTEHWAVPNTGADNSSAFTALPGGYRFDKYNSAASFFSMGIQTFWWSSSPEIQNSYGAWDRYLNFGSSNVERAAYYKTSGFSIRCLKGAPTLLPILTTSTAASITQTTATIGGNITSDGGAAVTAHGVCYGTTPNPTILNSVTIDGTGTGTFISSITALTANTTYYVRAYAINTIGTAYGNEISFATSAASSTITDVDGNIYHEIAIGTQTWMLENLKTTKYNDGTIITNVTDNTAWTTAGASYCWYSNDIANKATYGALYNWKAADPASNGNKNICPVGWHVPTDTEWKTLEIFLGMSLVTADLTGWRGTNEGSKLAGNASLWTDGVLKANSAFGQSGFTALPGGFRYSDGKFSSIGYNCYWWSSTQDGATYAWYKGILSDYSGAGRLNYSMNYGFSIRCLKGEPVYLPTVTTTTITAINQTTATTGGNISSDGGAAVTGRGVCYGTTSNPTILNSVTVDGTGTGTFISSITGLTANTKFYVRAFAINSVGTAYGNEISFTTTAAATIPTLTTSAITAITQTTATSGGNITSDGGAAVTGRGVCFSTTANPTILNSVTVNGTGIGSFTSPVNGLAAGTTYYLRAYANNIAGTAYGNQISFTTTAAGALPTLTTIAISSITQTSATSGGNITSDGGAAITARGVCWSTASSPTSALATKTSDGAGTGSFSSSITGLTASTTYYVRAYAINSAGTAYGNEISFYISKPDTILDSDGNVGRYPSVALDGNGYSHISYFDVTNNTLKYASNISGSWITSTIDNNGNVGSYSSIAIDHNNHIHISYYESVFGNLKYITNSSGSWVAETIDSQDDVGAFSSIAIDNNNKVHISYYDHTNYSLKYTTKDSGSWVKTTIAYGSSNEWGRYTSIKTDAQNKVHISFCFTYSYDSESFGSLGYITNASGSWVKTIIDNSTWGEGVYNSLAIDNNGKVHISYNSNSSGDLRYATNLSGTWDKASIDDSGIFTSIGIDNLNKVHILYISGAQILKHATNKTGQWINETILSGAYWGLYDVSMAIGQNGKLIICYFDQPNGNLILVRGQ